MVTLTELLFVFARRYLTYDTSYSHHAVSTHPLLRLSPFISVILLHTPYSRKTCHFPIRFIGCPFETRVRRWPPSCERALISHRHALISIMRASRQVHPSLISFLALVIILLATALILLLLGPLFNVNGALFLGLDDSEDVCQQ